MSMTHANPDVGTENKTRKMPLYRVLVHNDDVNSMDHVVGTLMRIFAFELPEAVKIMQEAHETGVALCKVEAMETAELHRDQLQAASLTATIEPED